MKKRGLILALLAMPAWVFYRHFVEELRRSPFDYELGSAVYPVPLPLRILGLFAVFTALVAVFLIVIDFIRWVKEKSDDATD